MERDKKRGNLSDLRQRESKKGWKEIRNEEISRKLRQRESKKHGEG